MQVQNNGLDEAIAKRMFIEKMHQRRDEVNFQIEDIRKKVIKAYREKGEDDQLSKILTSSYMISLKIRDFTEIMLSYIDLMQLVFGTMDSIIAFDKDFMSMMDFSVQNKSTIFTRWKQRRRIRQFKKQLRYKFDELKVKMESISEFAGILDSVMDSLVLEIDRPKKKRRKAKPQVNVVQKEIDDLRAAAYGTESTGGGEGTPGGSTGGNAGGAGVDSSGLF